MNVIVDEVNEPKVYNYSKIIRPTSMRSTYWKFYGFPADESGSIITRRSVICSICGIALSYNKNTSNLKSHLRSKHPEQMSFSCTPVPTKKPKFIYAPVSQDDQSNDVKQIYIKQQPNEEIVANPDDLIEILAEDIDGDEYQELNDDYQIEYLTSDDVHNFDEEPTIAKSVNSGVKVLKRKNSSSNMSLSTMESLIVSMLIDDLLPTTICEGPGFIYFVTALCANRIQIPNSKAIEKHLQRVYKTEQTRLSQSIKCELEDKYYSLGFEKWSNCDNSVFITTYINYVVDDEQLNSVIFNIVDCNDAIDWESHFNMLNLKNCAASIVDFDIDGEEMLKNFLETHNVPVIPCFVTTIAKAAEKCFANVSAQEIYATAVNVFNEFCRFVPDITDPPKVNKHFWMTRMNFIEFVHEVLVNNNERIESDTSQLISDLKTVIDCLTPLKLTLETLSMEQCAMSSLIRPLTSQLINSHFILGDDVSELENELNSIIHKVLEDSQTSSSSFLMQSSFMDPRFQNLQTPEDVQLIKIALKKLIHPPESPNSMVLKREKEALKQTAQPKQKSAGLQFFFGNKEQKFTPNKSIDRFDMEFNNYNANADAGLDQLVLSWWKDSSMVYPNLKKLANRFNCVQLSVQKCDLNLNKQIAFHEKRFMCRGNKLDCLLWLHQNRNSN